MPRVHVITNALTGQTHEVPLTAAEESALASASLPVPAIISDRQFFQQLAVMGEITEEEAEDAVATGAIPAVLLSLVDTLPAEQRFAARMMLRGATQFSRSHPFIDFLAAQHGWSSAQVDDLFRAAAAL